MAQTNSASQMAWQRNLEAARAPRLRAEEWAEASARPEAGTLDSAALPEAADLQVDALRLSWTDGVGLGDSLGNRRYLALDSHPPCSLVC